ncbi:MAG: PspC domain-containing protein [Anaerolineales bacterium]|nr:PspC domain-containing protein [Anaerolineales bacterium]
MKNLILITLNGYPTRFTAEPAAYEALQTYLQQASNVLAEDADRSEVLRDLEQSIGEKLAARLATPEQVVQPEDIHAVLEAIGPVGHGPGSPDSKTGKAKRRRPLVRIQEGQDILGICLGLSAYSDINVDWIRTIFIGLALVTGGVFILVYFAAAFFLPVVVTREEYIASYGRNSLQ